MEKKNNKFEITTNVLAKAAFLVALSIVLGRFLSIMIPIGGAQGVKVGFGGMPITMAGLLFGPVVGGMAGLASDLIGVLINPMGAYFPGFTLTATLGGVIPGLFSMYFRNKPREGEWLTIPRVGIMQFTNSLLLSLFLNTLWLKIMYGEGFLVLLPPRILNAAVNFPIQVLVIYNLTKQLDRLS